MTLSIDDFGAFHEAVHGYGPFDWQRRLLHRIVADRAWPRILDIPTGAGKTTCIDIALFALALDSDAAPQARWCPRRIAMVVDRRVIVDQAAERGRKLARALADPVTAVLAAVREQLLKLTSGGGEPLGVFTLRGGIPKDNGWARRPDQPVIVASTVDQIGSRLLMQGYGVSVSMRPVHAGLAANDVLLLLDEVHLSQPFAETLEQLARLRARFAAVALPRRFQFAFLSATPMQNAHEEPFQLEASEKALDAPLGLRLHASKPARLIKVNDRPQLELRCAAEAVNLLESHDTIVVVVNRVASARSVAAKIREEVARTASVVLLTGRMRPLDRDDVLRELRPRIAAGRDRSNVPGKLAVVSTQSIEAGADFDFDAIVTEAASLDALRQRFGRVDRLGGYGHGEGVIIFDASNKDDPVYGTAIKETFAWLTARLSKTTKTIDFGVAAFPLPDPDELPALLAPAPHAPIMLPAYLDLWSQSSPLPAVVADVALWMHGPDTAPAEVQVVWRVDIQEKDLESAAADERTLTDLVARVASIRPSSLEALALPFAAARTWLAYGASRAIDIEDVEGSRQPADDATAAGRALRWRGEESEIVSAEMLRPGDTLVVPASRGGLSDATFDPAASTPVLDLAEHAALLSRGRPVLRLEPQVLRRWDLDLPTDDVGEARIGAATLADSETLAWRRVWLAALGAGRRHFVVPASDEPRYVIEGRRLAADTVRKLIADQFDVEDGVEATTDPERSPHIGRPVALGDHSRNVERWARGFAEVLGFSKEIANDLALAAWLHDIGKADRRFQIMLRGGSEIEFFKDETPLAKSGMLPDSVAEQRLARERSGYPRGARHEVQSVAMLQRDAATLSAMGHDTELVLHLVGSHHGFCRPLAPVCVDERPETVSLEGHSHERFGTATLFSTSSQHGLHRLDSPLADRFWSLTAQYGWLELCWLESVLRLADHRASEEEQQGA